MIPGYSSMIGSSNQADTYVAQKRKILGSKLRVLCLLGIDAKADVDGYVLTCQDRISGGMLTRIRAGAQTSHIASNRGKRCITHDGLITDDAAFGMTTTWAPKSVLAVASTLDAIATTYSVLVRGNPHANDSTWLVRDNGTANLYNLWGTKYTNGTAGISVVTGVRCYESEKSDNTDTGVLIMAYQHITGAAWRGNLFELRVTDDVLTAEERAAEAALTKAFWGIV